MDNIPVGKRGENWNGCNAMWIHHALVHEARGPSIIMSGIGAEFVSLTPAYVSSPPFPLNALS